MKNEQLSKLYEHNQETGNYVIEIALDKYVDVFNDWDHSSYRKRDMDPELAFFLEDCSAEISLRHDLDLVFYLPHRAKEEDKEGIISGVVRRYYQFYTNLERRALEKAYRRMLSNMLIAMVFLSASYFVSLGNVSVALSIFSQGLTVGGWVFLWEAISFFFMKQADNRELIRTYERLARANISFRYDV